MRRNILLTKDQPSDTALKRVLRQLLRVMEANEDGVLQNTSSHPLHDFRVAVRQTRSLLSQIKGVLPARIRTDYRRRFRWLAASTGPLRDLDVYLDQFDKLRHEAPEYPHAHLEALYAYIGERRTVEYKRLVKTLRSARYRRLKEGWHRIVNSPAAPDEAAPYASRPIKRLIDKRIWKAYRRLVKEGAEITPRSADAELHELRKAGKKLRYLIQLFRDLYPRRKTRQLLDSLVALQDGLGVYQDTHVQMAALTGFEREMREADVLARPTPQAMRGLQRVLKRKQMAARAAFNECFEKFTHPDNDALFRALFKR